MNFSKSPTIITQPPFSSLNNSQTVDNQTGLSKSTVNLVQKVLLNLRNQPLTTIPDKQFLGGKLPSFLERIVQRIQNYFSVYNPPEYFEGNRPPDTLNEGIAVVCSNVQSEDLSCNPVPPEEYGVVQQECENIVSQIQEPQNGGATAGEDGYNIVVTHTVVHDNMINVYSPAETGTSQVVSNVVVILEPSAAEYSPPPQEGLIRNKDKFYVYVNPTAANKKKDQFQTKAGGQTEKPEPFQPYNNGTYTVIIKGNKLHEFSNNIENTDNGALHPEVSPYIHGLGNQAQTEEGMLTSRSVTENKELPDVPNINLVLVPPNYQRNKSCAKDKYDNAEIEYYILKPDNGNIIKPKPQKNPSNIGHKTEIDATSGTYLPPDNQNKPTSQPAEATSVINIQPSTSKFPLLFNLFKKKPEEPRTV